MDTFSTPYAEWSLLSWVPVQVSADYTAAATSPIILADTGAGAFTVTLPAARSSVNGTVLFIKNLGANTLTVAASGADTIDGASTLAMGTQYGSVCVCLAFGKWFTLASPEGGSSSGGVPTGNYAGGQPTFTPATSGAVAVDRSNGRIWWYYSGAWN